MSRFLIDGTTVEDYNGQGERRLTNQQRLDRELGLAVDLARGDVVRAQQLRRVPLFQVALLGHFGFPGWVENRGERHEGLAQGPILTSVHRMR